MMDPVIRPTDLVVDPNNPKVLRAYFPFSAGQQILATDSTMELMIEADFNSSVPKGISSTEGEILNYGYVRLGNKKIFMGADFMPFDEQNQYVYEKFGDMTSSNGNHSRVTATIEGVASSFALTDVRNGNFVKYFEWTPDGFAFCGSDPLTKGECKTLWTSSSTLGSAVPLHGGGFAVIRDVIPYFYQGAWSIKTF